MDKLWDLCVLTSWHQNVRNYWNEYLVQSGKAAMGHDPQSCDFAGIYIYILFTALSCFRLTALTCWIWESIYWTGVVSRLTRFKVVPNFWRFNFPISTLRVCVFISMFNSLTRLLIYHLISSWVGNKSTGLKGNISVRGMAFVGI